MSSLFGATDPTKQGLIPTATQNFQQPASQDMNAAIKDYVGQVMGGSWTDQQKAQMIRDQAAKVGVNYDQISQATGYSQDNVNAYLGNPSKPQIDAAEQSARQSWMDMGMEGRKQGVDPSVIQTLYSTNAQGQVVRNSDGYVSPFKMGDIKNPNAQEYYSQNPQELFALGALGGAGGQGYFQNAGVRGTSMTMGQLTPDQWYRGYTSNFEDGWDQDTSNSYRWAGQPSAAPGGSGVVGGPTGSTGATGSPSTTGSSSGSSTTTTTTAPSSNGTELVENRIQGLLGTDASGMYTNQVVRQAADRALQAFAGRGLLNSSMAQQAAQEAAISKATEIATTDAGAINATNKAALDRLLQTSESKAAFERELAKMAAANGYDLAKLREQYGLDANLSTTKDTQQQEWKLQDTYRTQRQQVDLNYNTEVNNINQSQMTPEQKAAAVQSAAATRDIGLATLNEVYSKTPGWKNEWSSVAVLANESSVNSMTNVSSLTAIVNDPAQSAAMKAAASARIAELQKPTGLLAQ